MKALGSQAAATPFGTFLTVQAEVYEAGGGNDTLGGGVGAREETGKQQESGQHIGY